MNTLVITDIDAKNGAGKSVAPTRKAGLKARNETLKTWVPEKENLDDLLDLKPADLVQLDKTGFAVRVAFQQPIQSEWSESKSEEALANTFEDALVYENIKLFRDMDGNALLGRIRKSLDTASDFPSLATRLAADLAKGGKAEFAMELLYSEEIDRMTVPAYIDQGLIWLADQLKRKEAGIAGKSVTHAKGASIDTSEDQAA